MFQEASVGRQAGRPTGRLVWVYCTIIASECGPQAWPRAVAPGRSPGLCCGWRSPGGRGEGIMVPSFAGGALLRGGSELFRKTGGGRGLARREV